MRGEEAGAGGERDSGGAAGTPQVAGGMSGEPEPSAGAGGQAAGGAAGQPSAGEGGGDGQPEPECGPETCPDGVCLQGVCELETIIDADVNLSSDAITAGRTCAEAIAYSVLSLTGTTATLAGVPEAGCLAAGDELLLINLQGTVAEHDNVGNWELLRVSDVSDDTVTFAGTTTRSYGTGASNAGLGTSAGSQRVALIRVPRFGRLVVNAGVTVTADAWQGVLGGVLALRAAQLELSGTLSAAELGYRGGRWSTDDITCSDSIQTEAGESIGGSGTPSTLHNLGASGGLGPGNTSFNSDNAVISTPGHAQAGVLGFNPKGRAMGELGAAYGSADGTKLTLGSGPGGALTCVETPPQPAPFLEVRVLQQAGGIALLLVDDLQVQPGGAISASPGDAPRDVAFAGGYVFISGSTLSLGESRVTALGSIGLAPSGPFAGQSNQASPGYIVVSGSNVTGTTEPAAQPAANGVAQ